MLQSKKMNVAQFISCSLLKQKTFPKLANQLTRELNKSITTLKQFGIDYCPADGRNHKDRTITLKYMPVSSDSVNGAVRDKTVEIIPAKAQDSVIDMKNEADIVSHSNNSAKDPFEVTAPIKSKRMPHSVRCRHSATGKERVRPRSLPDNNTGQFDEPSIQTD